MADVNYILKLITKTDMPWSECVHLTRFPSLLVFHDTRLHETRNDLRNDLQVSEGKLVNLKLHERKISLQVCIFMPGPGKTRRILMQSIKDAAHEFES